MDDLSSRFISAFSEIERHLRSLVDADNYKTFYPLVNEAANKDKVVSRYKTLLKQMADLRNFVVHEYRRERAIAVPGRHTVEQLEHICKMLTSPPTLIPMFQKEVARCKPDDPVGHAARKMHAMSFSQIPVYDDEKLVGLLTTEAISRWLAVRLEEDVGLLEEEPVETVLKHEEESRTFLLMKSSATVFEALSAIERSYRSGTFLQAIIVTTNGKEKESPLGIVTLFDMPMLRKSVRA